MQSEPAPVGRPILLMTRRLVLLELDRGDTEFLRALAEEPDVRAYLDDDGGASVEGAGARLDRELLRSYRAHGFGLWRLDRREAPGAIGLCGLWGHPHRPELAFALLPAWRGQGYALEAAHAVVRHARDSLGLARLRARCRAEHRAALRLLLALGMTAAPAASTARGAMRSFLLEERGPAALR